MAAHYFNRFPAAVRAMAARCKLSFALHPAFRMSWLYRWRSISHHWQIDCGNRRGRETPLIRHKSICDNSIARTLKRHQKYMRTAGAREFPVAG
jgi:hypothetical protein